ncbi:MAG: DUF2141 domain-containing protein [Pseudomonadota bacterium]
MRTRSSLFLLAAIAPAAAASLDIEVSGVRNAEGQVKFMLFDRAEGFRKETASREVLAVPAQTGTVQAAFRGLSPGRYAVIAYHDEDADGKLDLRFGMIPAEGYGLSNNPEVLGPPSFEHAAFDLDEAGRRIEIRLDY